MFKHNKYISKETSAYVFGSNLNVILPGWPGGTPPGAMAVGGLTDRPAGAGEGPRGPDGDGPLIPAGDGPLQQKGT